MADDKKKDMQDFNNLAKQFEAINKEALKLTDRRLAVNKGLVDSVKELNAEAEKYNRIQGQSTSAWAKMVNDARDYSEEIKKTSENSGHALSCSSICLMSLRFPLNVTSLGPLWLAMMQLG